MFQLFVLPTFGGELQLSEYIILGLQGKWRWLRVAFMFLASNMYIKKQEVFLGEASIK